jgi:catecholate siderophore receptor
VQKLLPNRSGMTTEHGLWPGKSMGNGGRPDVRAVACMKDCTTEPTVKSFLPDFARNAHGNLAEQNLANGDVGVVVRPVEPLSIYASYSVSSLPASGDQFASLSLSTETLKPESFENLEAGFKIDLGSRLMATGAAYRLDRENTQAPDPLNPGRVVQTGAQRSTGLELGLSGKVTDRWETVATLAVQSARITRQTAAAPAGSRAALTPDFTASLWNKVEVTPTLALGLGVVHQGDMFASISNAVTLPGFTRVDGAVFVRLGEDYRLQLNIENLGDISWSPTSHGDNNLQPGAPRCVRKAAPAE